MLTNQGLARLNAHNRATTATRERNRVAVPRTYTVPESRSLDALRRQDGIIIIRSRRNGLTPVATANPDGSFHSGQWSTWRAWSDEQEMGRW